jgi:hypothetical protein
MTPPIPGATVTREQEIGLQLPDGSKIFPPDTWHEHQLASAADREVILGLIRTAATSLGYPEAELLDRYHWVTRDKIIAVVYEDGDEMPITATGTITEFADATTLNGESVTDSAVQKTSLVD